MKNQLHLTKAREGIDGQQSIDRDPCPRLFPGLALCALDHRLAQFHVASWNCSKACSRRDGSAAEQNTVCLDDNTADNDLRILVGDKVAFWADEPLSVIAFWDASEETGHFFTM